MHLDLSHNSSMGVDGGGLSRALPLVGVDRGGLDVDRVFLLTFLLEGVDGGGLGRISLLMSVDGGGQCKVCWIPGVDGDGLSRISLLNLCTIFLLVGVDAGAA